jgi:hypothetical protein
LLNNGYNQLLVSDYLPSGKHTKISGKSQCLMGKSPISMCHVQLPEGSGQSSAVDVVTLIINPIHHSPTICVFFFFTIFHIMPIRGIPKNRPLLGCFYSFSYWVYLIINHHSSWLIVFHEWVQLYQ